MPILDQLIMYVLVIASDTNYRNLFVRNLVVRGYPAVGLASAREGTRLVANVEPTLIVLCILGEPHEVDLAAVRTRSRLDEIPLVLVSSEAPDNQWLGKWKVDGRFSTTESPQQLIQHMQPWLAPLSGPTP